MGQAQANVWVAVRFLFLTRYIVMNLTLKILGQRTQNDTYSTADWNCNQKRITPRIHYRVASVEVGYPLSTFRGTRELIHGGRCAYMGEH